MTDFGPLRVYLAGPMRGYPEFNFPEFAKGAARLRALGYSVWSPAENDLSEGFDPTKDDALPLKHYMKTDLPAVCDSDLVVVLPGWENSQGAQLETHVASRCNIPVYRIEDMTYSSETLADHPDSIQPIDVDAYSDSPDVHTGTLRNRRVEGNAIVYDAIRDEPSDADAFNQVRDDIFSEREVRITSSTGGQKGQKLAELGALDPLALFAVAEVAGFGSRKYARMNYVNGYPWSLSYDAMQRHLLLFWSGEDIDQESGLPHLAHAAWHCLALLTFSSRSLGEDDRIVSVLRPASTG